MLLTAQYLIDLAEKLGYSSGKNLSGITIKMVFDSIILEEPIVPYVQSITNCAKATVTRFLAKTFPDRNPIKDRNILRFLLAKVGQKYCNSCKEILFEDDFNKNKSNSDGLGDYCRLCAQAYRRETYAKDPSKEIEANRRRKENIPSRTPAWANLTKIKEIYNNCPPGCQVDHIIPLNGILVSGLHTESNLQFLTEKSNSAKSNSFDIEKFNSGELWYDNAIPDNISLRIYKKASKVQRCPQCNKDFEVESSTQQVCCSRSCANLYRTGNTYSKEFIESLIWSKPLSVGCKEISMSDNGLKKMAIRLGCNMPPPYYHSKSEEDKEKIYNNIFQS